MAPTLNSKDALSFRFLDSVMTERFSDVGASIMTHFYTTVIQQERTAWKRQLKLIPATGKYNWV